jgi:pimeloyl-ACP methyl ester carboxylesterase
MSTLALVYAVLPHMRKRGKGQIALISSLAAFYGLPITPSVTAIAPAVALFVLPVLALLAGWAGYSLGQSVSPEAGWLPALSGTAGFAVVVALGYWLERKLSLGWLLRTCAFVLEYSLGKVPELDQRMDRFAERIARYVEAADDDEILVVGHSLGANVAVSVLVRALAINPLLFRQYRPVGLLTLGGSIPLQGLLPWARPFRDELAQLAADRDLAWVDITAPQDIASFALLNPVTVSGVALDEKVPQGPQLVSARFRDLLSPETYDTATWNVFRMHFQYLMASEREAVHDYLSVTTDSLRFHNRFAESPSGDD